MMTEFGRTRTIAAGLVAVVGLAACGSSSGPVSKSRPTTTVLAGVIAQLQGGATEWSGDASITNAGELVTQRCMQQKGLVYYTSFVSPTQEAGGAWFPYPDQTLAYAQRNGYGLYALAIRDAQAHITPAKGGNGTASTDQEELYELSLRGAAKTRYIRALAGGRYAQFELVGAQGAMRYPTTGCTALGEAKVYGSITNYFDVTDQLVALSNILATRAIDSTAYNHAIARWRSCMQQAGYSYPSPDAARARLANEPAREQVTPAFQHTEIRVAEHDITCQASAGVRAAYAEGLAAAVPSLGDKLSADVLKILTLRQHAVAVANHILSVG